MEKPLKVAAYSGLFLVILGVLWSIFSQFLLLININPILQTAISMIFNIAITVLSICFLYGFIVLGRRFNSKLLVIMSWINIVASILFLLVILFINMLFIIPSVSAQSNLTSPYSDMIDGPPPNIESLSRAIIMGFLFMYMVIAIVLGIYSILFGIGLLKIKDSVEHAKAAGILNIVSGATYFIFIGFLVQLAAFIVEIIMFFGASKNFESNLG